MIGGGRKNEPVNQPCTLPPALPGQAGTPWQTIRREIQEQIGRRRGHGEMRKTIFDSFYGKYIHFFELIKQHADHEEGLLQQDKCEKVGNGRTEDRRLLLLLLHIMPADRLSCWPASEEEGVFVGHGINKLGNGAKGFAILPLVGSLPVTTTI